MKEIFVRIPFSNSESEFRITENGVLTLKCYGKPGGKQKNGDRRVATLNYPLNYIIMKWITKAYFYKCEL